MIYAKLMPMRNLANRSLNSIILQDGGKMWFLLRNFRFSVSFGCACSVHTKTWRISNVCSVVIAFRQGIYTSHCIHVTPRAHNVAEKNFLNCGIRRSYSQCYPGILKTSKKNVFYWRSSMQWSFKNYWAFGIKALEFPLLNF